MVVVPIVTATESTAFACKWYYASDITKELGLNNNLLVDTYEKINNLSANDKTN